MERAGYYKCKACQRGYLRPETLAFGKEHDNWTEKEWRNIRFSDETHFSFGARNAEYIVRNETECYCNDCTQFKKKREVNCFHCWAEVGFNYKGPLVFYNTPETDIKGKVKSKKKTITKNTNKKTVRMYIDPDNLPEPEALKKEGGNMTMTTYIEQILEPYVLPHFKDNKDLVLEEENDGAHGTRSQKKKVQKYKEKHGIKCYANPPSSPDLSIIEDCWRYLKQKVKKHKCRTVDQLHWAIETEWEQLPQEWINELVDEMPIRITEVIKRQGLSTQY